MNGWYERMRDGLAVFASQARRQPLRAAVLNTGELVLLDEHGNAQVLSVETTEMLRDVLDGSASIHPPVFPERGDGDRAPEVRSDRSYFFKDVPSEFSIPTAAKRPPAAGGC